MHNKLQLHKRMVALSTFLAVAAMSITSCGAFSFQASANPNESGGVDLSAGSQPAAQSAGLNQTTIILIVVGVAILILILIVLASRGKSNNEPPK